MNTPNIILQEEQVAFRYEADLLGSIQQALTGLHGFDVMALEIIQSGDDVYVDLSSDSFADRCLETKGKRLEMDSACSKRLFDETGYKAIAIDNRFIHDFVDFSELEAPLQSTSHGQPFVTGHRPFMTTITA